MMAKVFIAISLLAVALVGASALSDCLEIYKDNIRRNGLYNISVDDKTHFVAYCDMTNGGWTLIQRRVDGSVDFNRGWDEYVTGFGNLNGNFWLGLKYIYRLASSPVDILFRLLIKGTNETALIQYSSFYIDGPVNKYRMHVNVTGAYNSVASNYKLYTGYGFGYQNNGSFSTYDRLNGNSCYNRWGDGGWWYTNCWEVLLNNQYTMMSFRGSSFRGQITRSEIAVKKAV